MALELYTTTTVDFFKRIAEEICNVMGWTPELRVMAHSLNHTQYLGAFAFNAKDKTKRYLNLVCFDNKAVFLVNKYYYHSDWVKLSQKEQTTWIGATLQMPVDDFVFSLTDISKLSIQEIINLVSLNSRFEDLDSACETQKSVLSYIGDFYTTKQEREELEKHIKECEEKLESLKQANVVSNVLIPIATQCQELMQATRYTMTKSQTPFGLRVNIILDTKEGKKKLALLLQDDYPLEITGVQDNTFSTAQLPNSFSELVTHFR